MNRISIAFLSVFLLFSSGFAHRQQLYFQNEENFNFTFSPTENKLHNVFTFYQIPHFQKEYSAKGLGASFLNSKIGFFCKYNHLGNDKFSNQSFQSFAVHQLTSSFSYSIGFHVKFQTQKMFSSTLQNFCPEFRLFFLLPQEIQFQAILRSSTISQASLPNQVQFSIEKMMNDLFKLKIGSSSVINQTSFIFFQSNFYWNQFCFAAQIKTNHTPFEFGIGYTIRNIEISSLFNFHQQLGVSSGINFNFSW